MNEIYQETDKVPQIPWAKHTRVTGAHFFVRRPQEIDSVEMESLKVKASIIKNGKVHLDIDSKENIKRFMDRAPALEKSLLKYLKKADYDPAISFISGTLDWMNGVPYVHTDEPPPPYGDSPGVLDWMPFIGPARPPRIGRTGHYGSGSVRQTFDHWIGNRLSYVHIDLIDPKWGEALVVQWDDEPKKPEVWTGDVENFFLTNEEDFEGWENYQHYNDVFENGLLWALDYMGRFEENDLPEWAVQLIERDPDLLWPDVVDKLLPIQNELPEDLHKALGVWIDRRRAEAEEAAGQLRLKGFPKKKK